MRQILSEDKVSAEAAKGAGSRSRMPESGVYIPNYRGVNQSLSAPGGSGEISFMNSLAQMGSNYMAEQQELYDNMEVAQTIAQVDTQYRQDSEQYLQENATGRGYTEYITSKYNDASAVALSNASNANVKNKLQMLFERRKYDVANNAFQKEKEIYTGYALNETQSMLNTTLNELTLAPSEVQSLSAKYDQQVENMKSILPADKFEVYKKQANEDFLYTYGLGLIKERPYEAVSLVKGENFRKGLSPNRFNSLQKNATAEIEHREAKAKEYQRMLRAAQNEESLRKFEETKYNILVGTMPTEDEILADTTLTQHHKMEAIQYLRKQKTGEDRKFVVAEKIKSVMNDGTPLSSLADVSAGERNKYLTQHFQNEDEKRIKEGNKPMTLVEKVKFCEDYQGIFSANYAPLKNEIENAIMKSTDGTKITEACLALAKQERIPALSQIDNDVVHFAHLSEQVFTGTKDPAQIIALRDDYFSVTPDQEKRNREAWKAVYPFKERENCLKEFYESSGYTWSGWFGNKGMVDSPDKKMINDLVYTTLERVYTKTGSLTKAYTVAQNILKGYIVSSKEKGYLINPPRPENTGLTQAQLDQEMDKARVQGLEKAKKTGLVKEGITQNKIHFESVDFEAPRYSLYYLQDENDPDSREYLYNNQGKKIIFDFRN